MKIKINNQNFNFISDNSNECDNETAFLQTFQNQAFHEEAKSKACSILNPQDLYKILNINQNIKIIAITGTNGKTTTAGAIYSILLDLGKKVAMQGTRGFFANDKRLQERSLTTPPILQTMQNLAQASKLECEFFIMEVSSHGIFQQRVQNLNFAMKIYTNLTQDHLDFHKNMQEYFKVKSSFFQDESKKLINKDALDIKPNLKNTLTYGIENTATYKINAYSLKKGINALVEHRNKKYEINSTLCGYFNLENLLCASSCVDILLNPKTSDLELAIQNFAGVSGRMQIISNNPLIIIDYAHTPDGMQKVLDSMKFEKISVVFGAGGNRDKTKRSKMLQVAKKYANKIYITSDNPRDEDPNDIICDIISNQMQQSIKQEHITIEVDRKKAISLAIHELKKSEILMILGKGDENYQEIKGVKHHFDDSEVVKNILKEKNDNSNAL